MQSVRLAFERRDLAAGALFGAAFGWTLLSGALNRSSAVSVAGAIAVSAAAFAAARLATTVHQAVVPGAIIVFAAILAVGAGDELLSRHPLSGPLGYANAKGALFFLAAAAAVMLAATWRGRKVRAAAIVAAAAATSVSVASGTVAASSMVVLLILAYWARRATRTVAWIAAASVALTFAGTIVLGVTYRHGAGGIRAPAVRALGESRPRLWHEAIAMTRDDPLTGVGPGRFSHVSPTASIASDLRWAHNGFLQQAAEGGLPAMGLLLALFAWGFSALGGSRALGAAPAAAALAGLGILASIDYVLHFPAIPSTAAALVGAASLPSRVKNLGGSREQHAQLGNEEEPA